MTTYNGARFLKTQLNSFLIQTRVPDELVVCDDASSDQSLEILRQFKDAAPFNVLIHENKTNLGTTRNFDQAIELCKGDIIFLSDQDDIWDSKKIEKFLYEFADPNIDMVFSDAEVIDARGRKSGYRLWSAVGFTSRHQTKWSNGKAFNMLLRRNVVTGATMAFRSELRDVIHPIPVNWIHDAWIALLATALSDTVFIPETLISYREHGGNQIGAKKLSRIDKLKRILEQPTSSERLMRIDSWLKGHETALARLRQLGLAKSLQYELINAVEHLSTRKRAINSKGSKRAHMVLREFFRGRYRKYSISRASALIDLVSK